MIATQETSVEQIGKLNGSVTAQMGIDADATAHIMDILSKGLYKHPKRAVIREYSTNAYDAQIEAGVTRPIEVTLPTAFNPTLEIRDFGVGLTQAEIETIYTQYGASTKRASNDFNGMLGLGCKSAFAYQNRFTVVSIKDGELIQVVITRNEDGTGEAIVYDPETTSEPNGTIVKIPAKRGDSFEAEAKDFYYWWKPGTVLVNGVEPKHFDPSAEGVLKLAEGMYVCKNPSTRNSYSYERIERVDADRVVMGNVMYPHEIETGLDRNSHHLVVIAPIGAVSFTPSREALQMNAPTKAYIAQTEQSFKDALVKTLQTKIEAAPTRSAAIQVVAAWKEIVPAKVVPAGGFTWRKQVIPQTVEIGKDDPYIRTLPFRKSGYHNAHNKKRAVSIEHTHSSLWIEGFTAEKVTAPQAQKARKWAEDNKVTDAQSIVMIHEIPAEIKPWLSNVISYDELKKVKLPRTHFNSVASGRIPGSYDLWTTHGSATGQQQHKSGIAADEFKDWTEPLFYTTGSYSGAYSANTAMAAIQKSKGYTLVTLRSDRVAKFLRYFPNAMDADTAISAGFDGWVKSIPTDDLLALAISQGYYSRNLRALDEGKIDDPELSKYVKLSKKDLTSITDAGRVFQTALGQTIPLPKVIDMSARYPLMNSSYKDHTYLYVNALFAARQAGKTL